MPSSRFLKSPRFLAGEKTEEPTPAIIIPLIAPYMRHPFSGVGGDGAVTLDGVTTPAWASRIGNVYTMTRPASCTSLTLNANITLRAIHFLDVLTRLTGPASAVIQFNGNNGANATTGAVGAGGAAVAAAWNLGSPAGANGATNANGNAGVTSNYIGGNGGNSGNCPTRGVGLGSTAALLSTRGTPATNVFLRISGNTPASPNASTTTVGGGPGGGGPGQTASAFGGGGGAGGGIVNIVCGILDFAGLISANGGNGGNGNGTADAAGGGGGGGGGYVAVDCVLVETTPTLQAAGGTGGAGFGSGGNPGVTGGTGTTLLLPLFTGY